MDNLKYLSINLLIEVVKQKNIEALERLLSCFCEIMPGEQMSLVFSEASQYLVKFNSEAFSWLEAEMFRGALESMEDEEDLEDEEEDLIPATHLDIAHILLDESMVEGVDFQNSDEKISLSKKAKTFLETYFDLSEIEHLITSMRGRRKKKDDIN